MNLQPHVVVLHWIRAEFKRLVSNPEYLSFSLGGYSYAPSIQNIYGAKFIDNAIKWLTENECCINYCLGYRFDAARVPQVAVMFSGGTEMRQVMGDYAGTEVANVSPEKLVEFHAKDVTTEGYLLVPNAYHLEQKIWRGLTVSKTGVPSRRITGFVQEGSDADLQIIADRPFVLEEGLADWDVFSAADGKRYFVGGSFDRFEVKVYMDLPGDPELCEVMSSVMRAALKNARMYLIANGLNEVAIAYSQIGKNESYGAVNVWTAEFTVSGLMTDRWLVSDALIPGNMTYEISCERNL